METGVGQLSIGGSPREVSQGQSCQEHNECKDNNQRRGPVRRSLGKRKSGAHYLALLTEIKITFVQPNTGNGRARQAKCIGIESGLPLSKQLTGSRSR